MGLCVLVAAACAPGEGDSRAAGVSTEGDWTFITGNMAGQRYTEHTQINPSNFADLEVAWEYDASNDRHWNPTTRTWEAGMPPIEAFMSDDN